MRKGGDGYAVFFSLVGWFGANIIFIQEVRSMLKFIDGEKWGCVEDF